MSDADWRVRVMREEVIDSEGKRSCHQRLVGKENEFRKLPTREILLYAGSVFLSVVKRGIVCIFSRNGE